MKVKGGSSVCLIIAAEEAAKLDHETASAKTETSRCDSILRDFFFASLSMNLLLNQPMIPMEPCLLRGERNDKWSFHSVRYLDFGDQRCRTAKQQRSS